MLLSRQDAWLQAYFFARGNGKASVGPTNAQSNALGFADKLLAEFDQRFPQLGQLVTRSPVDGAVDDAMDSFAGTLPPELRGAVRGRLETLAEDASADADDHA